MILNMEGLDEFKERHAALLVSCLWSEWGKELPQVQVNLDMDGGGWFMFM